MSNFLRPPTRGGRKKFVTNEVDATFYPQRRVKLEGMKPAVKVGVALGGGAARALAHIGALKALEARGLAPSVVAGTSSGAIIAALYALGLPAAELEHRARTQNLNEYWIQACDFGLHRASLIHGRRFENFLERKYFYGVTFEDLALPLAVACTSVDSGELVVVRSGPVARAVVASCALPGLFAAVRVGDEWLVDGGLVATVPFAALGSYDLDLTVGVHTGVDTQRSGFVRAVQRWHTSAWGQGVQRRLLGVRGRGVWSGFARGVARLQASYTQGVAAPDGALLVRADPPLSWFDLHKSPQAVTAGERATLAALDAHPLGVLGAHPELPAGERA